jgi:two-component system response regulator FixJ
VDARIRSLTPREREVLDHVVAGQPTRAIAVALSTSPRTVDVHRARIMNKMKVDSVPELVQAVLQWRSGAGEYDT